MLAVTPDEAAKSLIEFIARFDMKMTGEYWAPRGSRLADVYAFTFLRAHFRRDIGTAENVLGKDLPTPLQLPW